VVLAALLIVVMIAINTIQAERRFSSAPSLQTLRTDISNDWTPFGGSWKEDDGTIENESEERGAKLMYGLKSWHNYFVAADVELQGSSGDAGLIIRANGEEEGVDSYHGYFAGIRDKDDVSFLGRADFGWDQYAAMPMTSPVEPGHWYHLTLVALDCDVAYAVMDENGQVSHASATDSDCLASGRIGLKSYSSAARWKNIRIGPADRNMLMQVSNHASPVVVGDERSPAAMGFTDKALDRYMGPIRREAKKLQYNHDTQSIASLKLLSPQSETPVTIRGVVTITHPAIYIQDSTGSITVQAKPSAVPVKIGDEVEAQGLVVLRNYTPRLRQANFRFLWPNVPLSPLAVSAFELAAGGHNGDFVELAGTFVSRSAGPNGTIQLTLSDDTQHFYVIAESSTLEARLRKVPIGSRLLVRGVATYNPDFTSATTPFALLLPSSASLEVIALPSWWSSAHILLAIACGLLLIFALQVLLIRIQRWRLRSVLKERERLALDMHDTLAQSFAGIGYQLQAVRDETPLPEPSRQHVEVALAMVHSSHEEAKRSIAALRPEYLGKSDLVEALSEYANRMIDGRSISVCHSVEGRPMSIPLHLADAMFRIGQEAISNAIRHARPLSISIVLAFEGDRVRLTLRDDGRGFPSHHSHVGLGLRGMEKRARNANASLQVSSAVGSGTTVTVSATITSHWTISQRLETILDFFAGA
jgi:signal transduction histidine kinase